MDDVFAEGEEVLMNASTQTDGDLVNIIDFTNELMSDLDEIRLKEFVIDVAEEDAVFGLTNKDAKQFIMISDDEHQNHILCRCGVLEIGQKK